MQNIQNEDNMEEEGSKSLLFWLYLLLKFLMAFGMGPGWTIADSIAVTAAKESHK